MGASTGDERSSAGSSSASMEEKPPRSEAKEKQTGPSDKRQRGSLSGTFHKFRKVSLAPEQRRAILGELFYEGPDRIPYYGRFYFLTAVSAIIATVGLAVGSPAIVIGAMLLAPLMTPILAGGAAMA